MSKKAPGRAHREGISLLDLAEMFPDEETATQWFESHVWPEAAIALAAAPRRPQRLPRGSMPYWCGACRKRFSVRTGTAMERTKIPLRKWAFAIYIEMTSTQGCLVDETAPGSGHYAKVGLVHAAPHPRGLELSGSRKRLRRPRRNR